MIRGDHQVRGLTLELPDRAVVLLVHVGERLHKGHRTVVPLSHRYTARKSVEVNPTVWCQNLCLPVVALPARSIRIHGAHEPEAVWQFALDEAVQHDGVERGLGPDTPLSLEAV